MALPAQTLDFVRSLADEDLLGILRSANVKLPQTSSGARSELEKRVKLMLSDCQRLRNMLPLGQATYPGLPSWIPDCENHAEQENDAKKNDKKSPHTASKLTQPFGEFYTLKESLTFKAMQDNMPGFVGREVGEHAFTDAGRTLLALAKAVEGVLLNGVENAAFFIQDEAQTSGIALRIISIRGCPGDPSNPIFFVLFYHETREHVISSSQLVDVESVSPTLRWVKSCMAETDTTEQFGCPINAQHLILRQLLYNARRVPADYKPTFNKFRKGALVHFTPSFILPLRPVSPAMLGHLSRSIKQSDCSAANCPGAFADAGICSRCGVIQYCSISCQSRDLHSHAPFCGRITRSKVVSFEACPPSSIGQYAGVFMNLGSTTRDMATTVSVNDHAKAGLAESRKKRPNQRLFLIKVQVGLQGTGPLMVYDQDKTFIVQLYPPREGGDERDAIAFKAMEGLSRKCTRWRGLKVFLYARHSNAENTRLEVLTDVLPGQEVPW